MFTLLAIASSTALATGAVVSSPSSPPAPAGSATEAIPSVVVTVENLQPDRGVFFTPPWIGIHDGGFDVFDLGVPADAVLTGDEVERLAEDGDNGPLSATFTAMTGGGFQVAALKGPGGPLAPGDVAAATLNLDPMVDRYLSFASMLIPSNDTFVGNDDPLAHPLFDVEGRFIARSLVVSGLDTREAGTELNDEVAENVAFLAQSAPDTGVDEGSVVTSPSLGFADAGTLTYPDGVLNHPAFAMADFVDGDDPLLLFRFRFVDLGEDVAFAASLTPEEEVQPDLVDSPGLGEAFAVSSRAESVTVIVRYDGLTGPLNAAHLHLGQAGTNGPVVLGLTPGIGEGVIRFTGTAEDLTGPLAGEDLLALVNEMAAGNVYVNLHTDMFPAGEIRGQLFLRDDLDPGVDVDLPAGAAPARRR